jgi:prolipoprotein diacylglyceryltransferase
MMLEPKGIPVEQVIPLHPAQIYESICYLIIFAVLITIYFRRHPNLKSGYLLGLFLILVFTCRFFIEFVKQDQVGFEGKMMMNMGQILSIPFIIAGLILVFRKAKTA